MISRLRLRFRETLQLEKFRVTNHRYRDTLPKNTFSIKRQPRDGLRLSRVSPALFVSSSSCSLAQAQWRNL
jgi:hypothetical protein